MSESLDTRQRQFLDHVRGVSDAAPDLADGPVPAALGLAVYVNAYRARLREALAADHPRLAAHLGDERWLALCDAYIDAHPSIARSVRTFGDRLPGFIARAVSSGAASGAVTDDADKDASVGATSVAIDSAHRNAAARSRLKPLPQMAAGGSEVASVGAASAATARSEAIGQPKRATSTASNESGAPAARGTSDDLALLAELARFERSLIDAFDAADAPRLEWRTFEALPADDWPGLRLVLHPSLRHLPTRTRAVAAWQSLGETGEGVVMDVVPSAVFVWRDAERITRFRAFAADEEAALVGLMEGRDFASVCEGQVAFHDAAAIPPRVVAWLRAWVDDGLVVGIVAAEMDGPA